jgi:hypothetical protein
MKEVKKCIVCGKPAKIYGGHVLTIRKGKSIMAGYCEEHEEHPCPNFGGITGCYGFYQKGFGKRKTNI